jgi:membrane-associated phospholipid phosphatase
MNPLLDAGIKIILFLQGLGAWLTPVMQGFSFLGREEFFLLVMPALYWCVDSALGIRVGILLMLSNWVNGILKIVLSGPRPYFYSSQVKGLSVETSFGVPSGHAQNSAVVWGGLAAWLRTKRAWMAASVLVFFIGLSRIYLGVHFPHDVLFGWLVGALLLWGALRLEPVVVRQLGRQSFTSQVATMFLISLAGILLTGAARLSLGAWTTPLEWLKNIAITNPGSELPDPLALSGTVTVAGVFFGLTAGALWLQRGGGYDASGTWQHKLLRYLIGVAGVAAIYFGLGAVLPRGESLLPYLLRYARYMLAGLWIAALAPLLFKQMGLAGKGEVTRTEPATQPQMK